MPSDDEIAFALDILDQIAKPALDKVEELLRRTPTWDSIARNDFCRYVTFRLVYRLSLGCIEFVPVSCMLAGQYGADYQH